MNKGRRYAVLIGSSRFDKEPNLNPLRCPEKDVDGMREVLAAVDLGAFEEPSVFKNADSTVVMHRIEETLSEATGADQVLIYYSGHGKTDLPGRLYLATANTEIKKLVTTSIPIETLRLLIENSSRSEEHTSELQSLRHLVCRLLLEKKKTKNQTAPTTSNNKLTRDASQ